MRKGFLCLGMWCALFIMGAWSPVLADETVYSDGFEQGLAGWSVDNGVWDLGTSPMAGPGSAHAGYFCAGTAPEGDYPAYTSSRLVSPSIVLPSVTGSERIFLRFWHWFSYSSYDAGYVQVSVNGGAWTTSAIPVDNTSPVWSLKALDLTALAGSSVRIAFYHTANRDGWDYPSESTGWYIDDVLVVKKTPEFSGAFESGWGDWSATNGIWQVGVPASGPGGSHGGTSCAATVLGGDYEAYTTSSLVSPVLTLPAAGPGEEVSLQFWQWFSYSSYDSGALQISVWDPGTLSWSAFTTVSDAIENDSPVWSLMRVDLTAYAGSTVRLLFAHTAGRDGWNYPSESTGWYIDDVRIVRGVPVFTGGFEEGWGDWSADNGLWEPGEPAAGPAGAHGGIQCAGTVLDGDYTAYTSSRLISPSITLPDISSGEEILVGFWHWFSYSSYDAGYVQVSRWDPAGQAWSAWTTVSATVENTSPVWSYKTAFLSAYAGSTIRIGFLHTAARDGWNYPSESTGWYIDDVDVFVNAPEFSGDFECGWEGWSADNGLWETGAPAAGPASAYSGSGCAGTVLGGDYEAYTGSRLISPSFTVPQSGTMSLSFRQWFSFSSYDAGSVQIIAWDDVNHAWTGWTDLAGPFEGVSATWATSPIISLAPYAGRKVKVAFRHTAARDGWNYPSESTGWYIDHVRITGFQGICECDLNRDGRCDMRDWLIFGQRWGATDCAGVPCACDLSHDGRCDMRDWLRFGEGWGRTTCPRCD